MSGLSSTSELIKKYGVRANKNFSQNFIVDPNINLKIAGFIPDIKNCTVIEIGPGPGGLSRAVLDAGAKKLIAIEADESLSPLISEIAESYKSRFEVRFQDALALDYAALSNEVSAKISIVANLPYSIATPLLIKWLNNISCIASMTLMFQKEVADRITASPGGKDYGRLSVMTQWLCSCDMVYVLPPSVFTPPPKVHSAVVSMIPRGITFSPHEFSRMEKVCAVAFNQRRKMLRGSLKSILPDTEITLKNLGIEPTLRAENLTVQDYLKLAEALQN